MVKLLVLAGLCLAAYLPSISIPLLEDDYPNLVQSLTYGTWGGQRQLIHDPTFRLRTTSYWVMCGIWTHAGLSPIACHSVSVLLHVAATWLLYLFASQWQPARSGSFWAAAFFAVHEGHQEAVMWFSAINELLLFLFGLGAMICWCRAAVQPWWNLPGIPLFALALISKESAIILLPLFFLVCRRRDWGIAPYAVLWLAALVSILASLPSSFRFADGSFSLASPFWLTLPRGLFRLNWIWGGVALVYLVAKEVTARPLLPPLFSWMAVALAPYSFLTYSTSIPSRQTYLASAGLAMLVGLAFAALLARPAGRRRIAVPVAALILAHNTGIIWVKKCHQFLERAAPTERLIAEVRTVSSRGLIRIRCFPRTRLIAEEAIRLAVPAALPRIQWDDDLNRCQEAGELSVTVGRARCGRPHRLGRIDRQPAKRAQAIQHTDQIHRRRPIAKPLHHVTHHERT